jgi:hypothetical protein
MTKYAIIKNGIVTNLIVAEESFAQSIGAIPVSDEVSTGDSWDGVVFTKPLQPPFDRIAAGRLIDKAVIAVYEKPTVLGDEYKLRESEAAAYKAAGYTGTVPDLISGFATPAMMSPQAATDLILSQAAQLRGALKQLGNLRMQKYAVTAAATDELAKATFDSTMSSITAIAAALT